ncbi:uncharacterized protein K452DRAFT_325544 [Aplosporella prunicola CBS 121167]|uniref:6-methylsalicylate decarboxylase n=1 Tax=Aplosporella prunicola CBS 121167 TaxID=1176127 RepID=A0A6A6BJV6_9PEZI|nr:uncharacterized protein K452DRAFT_325544 [Aplosporella prunicola CBS 121167]KAF2143574.1 hypothetical protein K452DRAFT_325544 [Aplosporella prunicola CBS 121167]
MALQRIDVHHHYVPPFYATALQEHGGDPSGWPIPNWTVEADLQFNDAENIAVALLSLTAPGADFLPLEQQAALCREANEYAADIVAAHPTRYGFLATIPSLLDPAAAQAELLYALDTLHADGVILYSRYGNDSHYLGHPDFRSTWDVLDERGVVVFVHPTHPVDLSLVDPQLPQPIIDYPHETSRAALDLIVSDTLRTHPNVSVILAHAGGTLPYLSLRAASQLASSPAANKTQDEILAEAKSFYFDTANSADPLVQDFIRQFARPGHVLFGSDYPYAPLDAIRLMDDLLDEYAAAHPAYVQDVDADAAVALFPRLRDLLSPANGTGVRWGYQYGRRCRLCFRGGH